MAETTIQGWKDFEDITSKINEAYSAAQMAYNIITKLQVMKTNIIDDLARKNEVLKVLDVHPIYSIEGVTADYIKLVTLKNYLAANGYVS